MSVFVVEDIDFPHFDVTVRDSDAPGRTYNAYSLEDCEAFLQECKNVKAVVTRDGFRGFYYRMHRVHKQLYSKELLTLHEGECFPACGNAIDCYKFLSRVGMSWKVLASDTDHPFSYPIIKILVDVLSRHDEVTNCHFTSSPDNYFVPRIRKIEPYTMSSLFSNRNIHHQVSLYSCLPIMYASPCNPFVRDLWLALAALNSVESVHLGYKVAEFVTACNPETRQFMSQQVSAMVNRFPNVLAMADGLLLSTEFVDLPVVCVLSTLITTRVGDRFCLLGHINGGSIWAHGLKPEDINPTTFSFIQKYKIDNEPFSSAYFESIPDFNSLLSYPAREGKCRVRRDLYESITVDQCMTCDIKPHPKTFGPWLGEVLKEEYLNYVNRRLRHLAHINGWVFENVKRLFMQWKDVSIDSTDASLTQVFGAVMGEYDQLVLCDERKLCTHPAFYKRLHLRTDEQSMVNLRAHLMVMGFIPRTKGNALCFNVSNGISLCHLEQYAFLFVYKTEKSLKWRIERSLTSFLTFVKIFCANKKISYKCLRSLTQ